MRIRMVDLAFLAARPTGPGDIGRPAWRNGLADRIYENI
jgi:hypothetical protein